MHATFRRCGLSRPFLIPLFDNAVIANAQTIGPFVALHRLIGTTLMSPCIFHTRFAFSYNYCSIIRADATAVRPNIQRRGRQSRVRYHHDVVGGGHLPHLPHRNSRIKRPRVPPRRPCGMPPAGVALFVSGVISIQVSSLQSFLI